LSQPTATTPPAGRYEPVPDARRTMRRRVWIAVGVVVALGLLAFVTRGVLANPVHWQDYGYKVVDDAHVTVTFDVTKPRASTVRCTAQALSESFGQVGVRTVTVGPAQTSTVRVTVDVQTAETAVSGTVKTCVKAS